MAAEASAGGWPGRLRRRMNKTGFTLLHREMRARRSAPGARLSLIENQVHTLPNDNDASSPSLRRQFGPKNPRSRVGTAPSAPSSVASTKQGKLLCWLGGSPRPSAEKFKRGWLLVTVRRRLMPPLSPDHDDLLCNRVVKNSGLAACKTLAQIKTRASLPADAAHASNCSVPTKKSSRDIAATLGTAQIRCKKRR